jgi:hypothetical protein
MSSLRNTAVHPRRKSNCNPHYTLAHMSCASSRPAILPSLNQPDRSLGSCRRRRPPGTRARTDSAPLPRAGHPGSEPKLGIRGRNRSWGQRHPYSAAEHESAGWPVTQGTKERAMEEEWHCTMLHVGSRRGAELGVRWSLGGKLLLGMNQPGAATVWAGRAWHTESKGPWPLMDPSQGRHSFPWPPGISLSCLRSNTTASLIDPRGGGPPLLSYRPPWAHYLGGYHDRLLDGPLGLPDFAARYLMV